MLKFAMSGCLVFLMFVGAAIGFIWYVVLH